MVTRRVDTREKEFRTIPISYLIQTANQFQCDIYVQEDGQTANVKNYDEIKRFRLNTFLIFYFRGSDEAAAQDRINRILLGDN